MHGQGGQHIKGFGQTPDAEVAAICDIDDSVINKQQPSPFSFTRAQVARPRHTAALTAHQTHPRVGVLLVALAMA